MAISFDFSSPPLIRFGSGTFNQLGSLMRGLGRRAFIVTGARSLRLSGTYDRLISQLTKEGIEYFIYDRVTGEPDISMVEQGVLLAKQHHTEFIVGIGGGSVLDTAKAIAGLFTNPGSVMDYLEGVGKGYQLVNPSLPWIAIPTTAGTGAEVTRNAVICSRQAHFKKSIRSIHLLPRITLVDPELTLSLPPHLTAWCGMDALTQLIEAYVSKKAQPLPDALALYGISLLADNLLVAYRNGHDLEAREKVALASLLSGLVLANAGLGAAHGLASALGAYYEIPHGLLCAILLPQVMELNLNSSLERYARLGEALTGTRDYKDQLEAANSGLRFIRKLLEALDIPPNLRDFNISKETVPHLARAAFGSSMSGNPRDLDEEELVSLLYRLL